MIGWDNEGGSRGLGRLGDRFVGNNVFLIESVHS